MRNQVRKTGEHGSWKYLKAVVVEGCMIKRFICWMWGHNIMFKAFTGNIIKIDNEEFPTYKWEKQKHCLRCGKE